MKKVLVLAFVTLAIATVITGMTAITTTQIAQAQKNFGEVVSNDYAKKQSGCSDSNECLGLGEHKGRDGNKANECGGDGCGDGEGKQFGKNVKNAASNTFNPTNDD
jgi:hypothetical protein